MAHDSGEWAEQGRASLCRSAPGSGVVAVILAVVPSCAPSSCISHSALCRFHAAELGLAGRVFTSGDQC